jgi:hypothetical protein
MAIRFVDDPDVTKIDEPVTKTKGRGRPLKGERPMTAAERKRASRQRKSASVTK